MGDNNSDIISLDTVGLIIGLSGGFKQVIPVKLLVQDMTKSKHLMNGSYS